MVTTIKTIRGVREYPTRSEYVETCLRVCRKSLRAAHKDGYALEQSGVQQEAHVSRLASEHYDMATVRGEDLRSPESF